MESAMAARDRFVEWYKRPPRPQSTGTYGFAAIAAAIAPALLSLVNPVVNLIIEQERKEEARIVQRKAIIRDELSRCLWARWDQIGSNMPAQMANCGPNAVPVQYAPFYIRCR
jgi:hypothetical protein